MLRTASLTSALLVTKGGAAPIDRSERPIEEAGSNIQLFPPRPMRQVAGRSAVSRDGLSRVALRLNGARHLRLRVAAAHLGVTANSLMVAAIDHFVDHVLPTQMGAHCACLAQGRPTTPEACCGGSPDAQEGAAP